MRTISIADLKAHLSAELKHVSAGEPLMVMDRKRPVACLNPLAEEIEYVQRRKKPYRYRTLRPLIESDPQAYLEAERGDR